MTSVAHKMLPLAITKPLRKCRLQTSGSLSQGIARNQSHRRKSLSLQPRMGMRSLPVWQSPREHNKLHGAAQQEVVGGFAVTKAVCPMRVHPCTPTRCCGDFVAAAQQPRAPGAVGGQGWSPCPGAVRLMASSSPRCPSFPLSAAHASVAGGPCQPSGAPQSQHSPPEH